MLVIDVSAISDEGMDLNEALNPGEVHLQGDASFALEAGGSLRCHLERGDDRTVHVRGHLAARLGLECGRCLEPFGYTLEQDLDLFYLPHRADQEEEDEVDLTDREMVVAYYSQDRLDLGEMVREQFFLSIPMKRLCREDCLGLCLSCGSNRNVFQCGCPAPVANTRLAPFGKLFGKGSS